MREASLQDYGGNFKTTAGVPVSEPTSRWVDDSNQGPRIKDLGSAAVNRSCSCWISSDLDPKPEHFHEVNE